jgi:2-polyprenyl-3-methyl-5-hydroxy-6-metoxy-1,4-benzoquinol methylase
MDEASYPLDILWEDVQILRTLAALQAAPMVGDFVYYKTVVSEHPGAWWADPVGAYGYEMIDANTLPPGKFDFASVRQSGLLAGSPGAWNDLNKSGNVVNGYLVDIHRSGWDRLRWARTETVRAPVRYTEDSQALREDTRRDGQFPFGERELAYQEYHLGRWQPGEREVRNRAKILGYSPSWGETVLDIGTQVGSFLQYVRIGVPAPTPTLVGLDFQPEYVDLARRLARASGWNICFRQWDISQHVDDLVAWLTALWPGGVDHLLMLSMLKHIPSEDYLWMLIDRLNPRHTYLETNAVKEDRQAPLFLEVLKRGGQESWCGWSNDRNRRACYHIVRHSPQMAGSVVQPPYEGWIP